MSDEGDKSPQKKTVCQIGNVYHQQASGNDDDGSQTLLNLKILNSCNKLEIDWTNKKMRKSRKPKICKKLR